LKQTYQIEKGPDGIVWLTVQPLMADLKEAMEQMLKIDTANLPVEQSLEIDMRIAALRHVYTFLGSLLTEQTMKELRENHAATKH